MGRLATTGRPLRDARVPLLRRGAFVTGQTIAVNGGSHMIP